MKNPNRVLLKPCPFCAPERSKPEMKQKPGVVMFPYYVWCAYCHAQTNLCRTQAQAVNNWNIRKGAY